MKLFTAQQIKAWDDATILETPISSIDLMERAAIAFSSRFQKKYDHSRPISVLCGMGNNGGDGLAIARILSMDGFEVKIWLADFGQTKSKDFTINLNRLPDFGHIPLYAIDMTEPPVFNPDEILIDALLGTGINRPLDGDLEDLIHWLNSLHHPIVSVDIPSGLFADAHCETAIMADHTITFQVPKISFLLPTYEQFTGSWETVDIGLIKGFALSTPSKYFLSAKPLIRSLVTRRKKFSHKGTYGHALLINGSYGKGGAAILAARACLRSGVGLLTNHLPSNLYDILQTAVPEAMASVDEHDFYWSSLPDKLDQFAAAGVGCGIDQKESTERVFESFLSHFDGKLVLDADAINLLSKHPTWLSQLPAGTIVTPHVKEFERLFGPVKSCFDRIDKLREHAMNHHIIIVLKGAHTAIGLPDGTIYFNDTGNPGMATAGSGDVLTGILTGLLAQGYDSQSAALIGTFVHGMAGDLAYEASSYESLIASDIINHLGKAFHVLFHPDQD